MPLYSWLAIDFEAKVLGTVKAKNRDAAMLAARAKWGVMLCYVEKTARRVALPRGFNNRHED